MNLVHNPEFQPRRQHNWHLHLQALDWHTHEFSAGSLYHMSQDKPPTLSTLTIHRQLESSNNTNVLLTVEHSTSLISYHLRSKWSKSYLINVWYIHTYTVIHIHTRTNPNKPRQFKSIVKKYEFSAGSLYHMSQDKPPTLSTLTINRQLESSNNTNVLLTVEHSTSLISYHLRSKWSKSYLINVWYIHTYTVIHIYKRTNPNKPRQFKSIVKK